MTRKTDLAAQARAVQARATKTAVDATEASSQVSTEKRSSEKKKTVSPRVKPVRVTVDLSPVAYRAFRRWCADTADEIGAASVPGSDVLRILVDQLVADPRLATTVQAALEKK